MSNLSFSQGLQQQQTQHQTLSQVQQQSLKILQATTLELQALIREEAEINPLLELGIIPGETLIGDPIENVAERSRKAVNEECQEEGESVDTEAEGLFEDQLNPNTGEPDLFENDDLDLEISHDLEDACSESEWLEPTQSPDPDAEERYQFIIDSLTETPHVQDLLLEQLRSCDLDETGMAIGEAIIGSLNDAGYLSIPVEEVASMCVASTEDVNEVLTLIQEFDPPGIAARDLRECLLLQLQRKELGNSDAADILRNHWENWINQRLPNIAKAMNITQVELDLALQELRDLNPHPSVNDIDNSNFSVIPEVSVTREATGNWSVKALKGIYPALTINTQYLKLLNDPKVSAAEKKFIREKHREASNFLKGISDRTETLLMITQEIVSRQTQFFEDGSDYLQPMTLRHIGEATNLHESTISRAIAGKYLITPHGTIPFRDLFVSSSYQAQNGSVVSANNIKQMIEEFIDNEDPDKPLSDHQIEELLKTKSFSVARRTIMKYREELGIPSTKIRRQR